MNLSIWNHSSVQAEDITAALDTWLTQLTAETPAILIEAMRYSLLAPGKRFRPLLVILSCQALTGRVQDAIPAAVAVEMVHTYSLIHDDLPAMDDDDLRRGLPTSHKKYGEALAILAGDGLLTLSFEVLSKGYSSSISSVMCAELARGAGPGGMVGGQVLDLLAEGKIRVADSKNKADVAILDELHRRKTGALIRAALRMGAHAARLAHSDGDFSRQLCLIDQYADCVGLAFQITDDLLDVESNSEIAGKRVGKDAARGKLSYPGCVGVEKSRHRAIELVEQAAALASEFGESGQPLVELARCLGQRER